MDIAVIAAIVLIALGSAIVQSTIGFGYSLLFAPLAALIIAPREAIAVSLVTATVLALGLFVEHRPRIPFQRVAILVIGGILGTPLGLVLLVRLDAVTLHVLVSLGVIASAVVGLARAGHVPVERTERFSPMALAGVLSGVMRGAVSFPGPPIVLYLHWAGGTPHEIRGRLFAYFLWTAIPAVAMAGAGGVFTRNIGLLSLVSVPAVIGGILIGRRMRVFVSVLWFARLSMLLLALASIAAIIGAVLEWQR